MPSVGDPRTSAFRCQPHIVHEAPSCVPGCPRVAARVAIGTEVFRLCSGCTVRPFEYRDLAKARLQYQLTATVMNFDHLNA